MKSIVELGLAQSACAYVFIIILLLIVKVRGINRTTEILISSIRMTVQLVLTGYLLLYIFNNPSPLLTLLIIGLMELFSVITLFRKVKKGTSLNLKKASAIAMISGTFICIAYFLFVVVRISPWYDPRYFIPISGMIIGNSMTAVSLAISRLVDGIDVRKNEIETSLMLGASPKEATKEIVDGAFDSAILPTMNSMIGMGIVFLPGMMTGQILSGTSPTTAIQYQIAIMLGITGSVAICTVICLQLGYKTFFNEDSQLIAKEQR